MIEQALVCAAKYRVLALNELDQLMVRLLKNNAIWLESTAARLKHTGNLLNDVPVQDRTPAELCFRRC